MIYDMLQGVRLLTQLTFHIERLLPAFQTVLYAGKGWRGWRTSMKIAFTHLYFMVCLNLICFCCQLSLDDSGWSTGS